MLVPNEPERTNGQICLVGGSSMRSVQEEELTTEEYCVIKETHAALSASQ